METEMEAFSGLPTGVTGLNLHLIKTEVDTPGDSDLGYRSSFDSSSSNNTSPSSLSTPATEPVSAPALRCVPKAVDEDTDITEAIKKLWTMEFGINVPFEERQNLLKSKLHQHSYLFHDRNQDQEADAGLSPVSVPAVSLTAVDCPTESSLPIPVTVVDPNTCSGSGYFDPNLSLSSRESDETILQVDPKTQAARLRLTPKDFIVYPRQSRVQVGWEAVFFLEQVQNGDEPFPNLIADWIFQIELTRPCSGCGTGPGPGGSSMSDNTREPLVLHLDAEKSRLGHARYFCSFLPVETGLHVLSILANVGVDENFGSNHDPDDPVATGVSASAVTKHIKSSPLVIPVVRCYSHSKGDNFFQMPRPPLVPFCSKASAISVYRPNNWIYVADQDLHQIVIVDPISFHIIHRFGSMGSCSGQLFRPAGVAVDHVHERVIVTDQDNHRVSVFGLEGNCIFNFGTRGGGNGQFEYPWGVAVSPKEGIVAVADSRNHRVQLFDHQGKFLRKYRVFRNIPFPNKQELGYPRGVCFNSDGSLLYVTDLRTSAVLRFSLDFRTKKTFIPSGCLLSPTGLAVDEADNVLIADSKNNSISIVSPVGCFICSISRSGQDGFQEPLDVAVLKGGKIAVVDRRNRLRIF